MSVENIRNALAQIQDDPDDVAAWTTVEDGVVSDSSPAVVRELEMARVQHERVRNWPTVARLLELELAVDDEPAITGAKQYELARIYHDELFQDDEAMKAYRRAEQLKPGDDQIRSVIGDIEFGRANLDTTVEQALVEALDSEDDSVRVPMLLRAAESTLRWGDGSDDSLAAVADFVSQALAIDGKSLRGQNLAAVTYGRQGEWSKLAEILDAKCNTASSKDDKIAAAYQLALVTRNKLDDEKRAVAAHQALLDLDPGNSMALQYLVDLYSRAEEWDHLVALYEDQLNSGVARQADELGIWVQLAMLQWRTRGNAELAEPYFDKIRRVEPTHATMLSFFREQAEESGDSTRLMSVLTDAQRALDDDHKKAELAEEIAGLAEGQENARRAIEQYKTILRSDPDNEEARAKLKTLYLETESHNALIELHRQDLQRVDKDDPAASVALLREIATIYKDKMEGSDTALLTVYTQILQHDENDIAAVRGLVRVYENLGRWRDLLNTQQKMAELTDNGTEKESLLRAVARRWLDQFSNVQNAIGAYEALLEATGGKDPEAREKLSDLYKKRRAWDKLYELNEAQLESLEGEARTELMLEMAKLAAERLNRGDDAIRLLKEVLVFEPSAEGVLDQLERQAERQKDYTTVAFVLDRRIEEAEDDKTQLALLQKLGVLFSDKLEDAEASNEAWRRVLAISPGHKRALRVLRAHYVETADWPGLEELYESQEDWEGLADFMSTTADRSKDDAQKIELSFRAARVYVEKLEAPERAARSYERVLGIDEVNVDAAKALLPIYTADEKWSRIPALYDVLLVASDDVDEKIDILHRVAEITGGPLANKTAALDYARQAYELRPNEEGLGRLQEWSHQSGEWSAFIEVVNKRLQDPELGEDRQRELRLLLAEVYAGEGERMDDAVAIYRSLLEADPSDERTAAAFEGLLRAADRRDDLRWLFELKVGQADSTEQCEVLEEWATVEEEVFGEPERAVELLRRVVDADATRTSALSSLTRLLLAAEDYQGARVVMIAHRDATTEEERVDIETRLAQLNIEHLEDPAAAFEACVRALGLEPAHPPIIELLEELMNVADTRPQAAAALERIYAEGGASEKQVVALRALLESVDSSDARLELCLRLADVHEHELGDAGGAFEVILNTLLEAPGDLTLWDRAQELGIKAGRPTDLAQAYRKHLAVGTDAQPDAEGDDAVALDAHLQLELCERAAVLHEEQLGDMEGAVPYLERMLELEPRNERAFDRLKAILNSVERWGALEELYQRTIAVTEDEAQKIELLHQAALIAEDMIGNDETAIGYYERIHSIDSLHERATDALERLYAREERFGDLATLLEQRLETATDDEAAPIQKQLVELYLHQLEAYERVMGHLDRVLRQNEDDLDARALAEECLRVPSLRQVAATLLDHVYETADDPRDLVRVLDVRLEGAEDEEQQRALLHRIAALRDERLKDDDAAFEAYRALMPLEPDDEEIRERMLDVGRRLGENEKMAEALLDTADKSSMPSVSGKILMEAAQIFQDRLGDLSQAEKVYRRVIEIDQDDPELVIPAAKSLAEIYQGEGKHQKLAEVLAAQVRLVSDTLESREIYARIADLYEDLLENDAKAIEAWKARLSDDPADTTALGALERLYERTEQWRELVEVLHQLEQAALEGDERKRCMVKAAEVLASELGETADAINGWRSVLDDFGPEPETLAALAKLYERAARWDDLAEVYDVWISLSDDMAERVKLFAGLGDVRRQYLNDAPGALAAYREVLIIEPSHAGAREALAAMLEHEDADIKREAAEIIGPLYEADGDAERLLTVLNIEIEATYDPTDKLETLERALMTAEDTMGSPTQAFDYACRGVRDAIGQPSLHQWIGTAERLAAATERESDLLELFESVVDEILDAEAQQSTRLRAGELARENLKDTARAIKHYRAALEARTDDQRAMAALIELYEETENNPELLEILKVRAELAGSDAERIELLFRVAQLQAGPLAARDSAIETYEDIINMALDERAVVALEGLYGRAKRHVDLVALYERLIDTAEGEALADIRVKIAMVLHEHLSDTARALDELGEALAADPAHQAAITTLERLLEEAEEPDQRSQVAEMLEPVYLAAHDWTKLKGALEARLETSQDPGERGELLMRLATLYEEQLEDYSSALDTVAKRLREEPTDEDIWGEVERLGRVLGDGSELRVAEIFASALTEVSTDDPKTAALSARTGELFDEAGKLEESLKWYTRAYEYRPDSKPAFEAIDSLLVRLERKEDRIYHYRQALDNTFEDDVRVKYLHVVARLHRELEQDDDAISTLRELLDSQEDNDEALDALTELFIKNEQTEDLADLYERRAELAGEPPRAAPFRIALARLLKQDPASRDRALDQLDIIVMELPSHEEAIHELEEMLGDSERKLRVIDLLRPIYDKASNWEGLVRLDNERMSLADLPDEKVDVLLNTAQLWEDQGADQQKAFEVVRDAFELVPENEDTRANLERLAEALNAWSELADSYTDAVDKIQDDFARRQLLSALATVCDQQLDDPRRALGALTKISDADPTDADPLERMDVLATLLADWPLLVTVLTRKAENAENPQDRSGMLQRLGDLKRDMLADEAGAILVYESALEIAPESVGTLDRLIQLYDVVPDKEPTEGEDVESDAGDDAPPDPTQRARRLADLLEQRIDYADAGSDERHAFILHAADVFEKRLDNAHDAIRMLQTALDERPTDEQVLASLERLYRSQELYDELLDNLKTQASVASEPEHRLSLRNKIGDLYIEKLDNAFDALEQYRLVLDEDEADSHAIAATMKIAESYEELRLEVSALLEPVLTAAGRNEELVLMMEHRFSAQTDPSDRARTLAGIALIQEEQLDNPKEARDTLLRALVEAPDDAQLHDDIHRLCELTEEWGKYADILSERADETYDAVLQTDLFTRLGRIAEERLQEPERAIRAFQRASELAEKPAELYEALDRLYTSTERWEDLAKVLERRAELEEAGTEQAELYYRLGKLQIDSFENREVGLGFLRQAADLNAEHAGVREELEKLTEVESLFEEVAETLDTMYRVAQDSAGRAKLRNKRISYAPTASERVRLRLELAQMLEDESFDTKSAQDVIQQALADDPTDPEVLEHLERLAATNTAGSVGEAAWLEAAKALGDAVAKALEAGAEGGETSMTSELARDLYLRSATWYTVHVDDAAAAEKHLRAALAQDARSVEALLALEKIHRSPGREKDLVATLSALAALSDAQDVAVERSSAELRREAKVLVETALEDPALAEQILRDMLNVDDADAWALTELSQVCEKKEAWEELFTLLTRRMDLMPEPALLRELRHQAASVAADKRDDSEGAISLYEQAFEDDPSDQVASDALRELYTKLERYDDMLRFTERLIDMADAPDERAKLRLESAHICIEILNAPTEGIENLNAVLEEVPGHEGAVKLLSSMLEKEGRDDELADLLKKQIEVAREAGEQQKELGFRVKLSELYESRLNDPDKAIEGYLGVLEADGAFRPALEALARLYEQQEQAKSAAGMYEKLIVSAPAEDVARLVLKTRDLYIEVDDREAASRVIEEALEAHKDLEGDRIQQLRDGLRTLYRERKAWEKLAALIEREADEAEGADEKVVKFRKAAEIHATERNDHGAAALLLEKALELKSDDRDLMLTLCDEYTSSGRGKDAIDVLNRVVESYGGRRSKELADIHHRIANAHLAEGDASEALKDLESARKMDPGSVVILNELGTLSLRMAEDDADNRAEHLKRAGNAFRSLLLQRLDADSPVSKASVFYSLALVSQAEGDTKKAKQMAERAIANDKDFDKAKTLLDELKG